MQRDSVRNAARRGATPLGLSLLFAGLTVLSGYLHLRTPPGADAAAYAIGAAVSRSMRGRLEVEQLRTGGFPEIDAGAVVAYDPSGEEVMRLTDVRVTLDAVESLRQRGFHVRSAAVGGGTLDIVSASGTPTIEQAFNSPSQSDEGGGAGRSASASNGRKVLDIREVSYRDLQVRVSMGHPPLAFAVNEGVGRFWVRQGDEFQGRFWGLDGQLRSDMSFASEVPFEGAALTIDPHGPSTVRFVAGSRLLATDVTVAGHAPRRSGGGVRLCVWTGGDPLASLGGLAAEVADGFASGVSFDLRPSSAPEDPRCEEGAA